MKVKFHVSTDNSGSDIEEEVEVDDNTSEEELEEMLKEFVMEHTNRYYEILSEE